MEHPEHLEENLEKKIGNICEEISSLISDAKKIEQNMSKYHEVLMRILKERLCNNVLPDEEGSEKCLEIMYLEMKNNYEKLKSLKMMLRPLAFIEKQAAFWVLKKLGYDDKRIQEMPYYERKRIFRDEIKRNPEKYAFSKNRDEVFLMLGSYAERRF